MPRLAEASSGALLSSRARPAHTQGLWRPSTGVGGGEQGIGAATATQVDECIKKQRINDGRRREQLHEAAAVVVYGGGERVKWWDKQAPKGINVSH